MSGKSRMRGRGAGKVKWIACDTFVKRRKCRKLEKVSRRKNRSK